MSNKVNFFRRSDICRRMAWQDMMKACSYVEERNSTGVEKAPLGFRTVAYAAGRTVHMSGPN